MSKPVTRVKGHRGARVYCPSTSMTRGAGVDGAATGRGAGGDMAGVAALTAEAGFAEPATVVGFAVLAGTALVSASGAGSAVDGFGGYRRVGRLSGVGPGTRSGATSKLGIGLPGGGASSRGAGGGSGHS